MFHEIKRRMYMAKTIALAGTFDTKGKEYLYVKELIESLGFHTFTMNTGVFEPEFDPDVTNEEIMGAAGEDWKQVAEAKDRAKATEVLAKGMEILVPKLYEAGKFDGILSFGGSGGTSIVTPGMRALPVGVPKVMVSTLASGNTEPYVGTSDIVMIPSLAVLGGLIPFPRKLFAMRFYGFLGSRVFGRTVEGRR